MDNLKFSKKVFIHTIAVLNVILGYTRQENANVKCECCPWGPLAAFINTVLIVVFTGENLEYEKWIRGFSLMWKVIKLGTGDLDDVDIIMHVYE